MSEDIVIGCKIKGKDLFRLLFKDVGVLIYEGNVLKFIDPETMEVRKYALCNPAYIGKVIFLSNEFGLKHLLDPAETYELEFHEDLLSFRTSDGRVDLVIGGQRL